MNKNSLKIISAILAISLAISACGIASTATPPDQMYIPAEAPTATHEPPPEFYAGFTQNEEIPFLMVHQSGESLGAIGDTNSPIKGVVWVSSDGASSMIIYSNDDGLPQSAVVGEDVILYSNYTYDGKIVDITILHQDGTSETFQAQLDTELLNKIWSFSAPSFSTVSYSLVGPQQPLSTDWLLFAKQALYLAGAASCLVSLTGGPLTLAMLGGPCAGALIGGVIMYGNLLGMNVAGLENFSYGRNIVLCLPGTDLKACLNTIVTTLDRLRKLADQKIANPPPAPATEPPAVTYGTLCGWVENNSFTGALAPTLTDWETNQVVELGALDSSKLQQFLDAGIPGYFRVFDPSVSNSFLLDFSYAEKVGNCSQTQIPPPTQPSSITSSVSGTLCGQYLQTIPFGAGRPGMIFQTNDETFGLYEGNSLGDNGRSGDYYRIYGAVIVRDPQTFSDGTHVERFISSWSGYDLISGLQSCSQPPTQPPVQPSTGGQARISNEIYYAALRQSPGYSNKNNDVDLLANVPAGDIVQILDGPEEADGLYWWYVSWNGITGWMADHTGSGKTIMIFLP